MALNTSKCNHLTPLRFKGLKQFSTQLKQRLEIGRRKEVLFSASRASRDSLLWTASEQINR